MVPSLIIRFFAGEEGAVFSVPPFEAVVKGRVGFEHPLSFPQPVWLPFAPWWIGASGLRLRWITLSNAELQPTGRKLVAARDNQAVGKLDGVLVEQSGKQAQ